MRLSVIIPVPPDAPAPRALADLERALEGLGPVEVIVSRGRAAAQQRNHAARAARAPVLYFLDDDSEVEGEALRRGLKHFEDEGVAGVGGPALTRLAAGFWEACFGEVTASRFGVGRLCARNRAVGALRRTDGEELILCNLMLRASWHSRVQGLDDDLYPGEDVDLWKRLRAAGATMLYDPEMAIRRPRRKTVASFLWQYFRYGQGRGCRWRAHDLPFLLPLAVWLLPLVKGAVLAYALASLAAALRIAGRRRNLLLGLACWPLFAGLHLAYGAGMALGLTGRRPPVQPDAPQLEVLVYGA